MQRWEGSSLLQRRPECTVSGMQLLQRGPWRSRTPRVLGLRARQGLGRGALQGVPVQHHRAQQPSSEGPQEVMGSCGVVGLDDIYIPWGGWGLW